MSVSRDFIDSYSPEASYPGTALAEAQLARRSGEHLSHSENLRTIRTRPCIEPGAHCGATTLVFGFQPHCLGEEVEFLLTGCLRASLIIAVAVGLKGGILRPQATKGPKSLHDTAESNDDEIPLGKKVHSVQYLSTIRRGAF